MKPAIAVFALVAGASAYNAPSYITCAESGVSCKNGYDPHVTRCKPWDGSTEACTKICCAAPPPSPPPPPPSSLARSPRWSASTATIPRSLAASPGPARPRRAARFAVPPHPLPPSFVRCDSKQAATPCKDGYKTDPKVGGVMRCKLWEGSTEKCGAKVCCKPPPPPPAPKPEPPKPHPKPEPPKPAPKPSSLIPCDGAKAAIKCKHGYKKDPKTHGVMRCKLAAGSTVHCSEATCCAPPPPPPKPDSFVRCDTVKGLICPYGFKVDPKVGGVMRCKTWAGSKEECNAITCCAAKHY